jgi:hypothetical protein
MIKKKSKRRLIIKPYSYYSELINKLKQGYQVAESLAIINRNGRFGLNKEFCQGIMKKENIEILIT